jgi:ribosomal-protein-alanine N-acetyltransferase
MNNDSQKIQISNTNLILRSMTSNDIHGILSIENARYDMLWSAKNFLNSLIAGHDCWLLERDNTIIAYAVMAMDSNESYILNLCVEEFYRRKGYGTLLMKYLLKIAKNNLATVVFLKAKASKHSLHKFYMKLGFVKTVLLQNYYEMQDKKEDALIFILEF